MSISRQRSLALGCSLSLALLACGDDHHHHEGSCGLEANCTDTVAFMQGLTRDGEDGALSVRLIAATPAPPIGGELDADGGTEEGIYVDNHWQVQVVDSDGNPVTGASVDSVRTWSMDCMHYGLDTTDDSIVVTDNGDGTFSWTHQYVHGGPWSVDITVSAGSETDVVKFPFCLPQTDAHHHH